MRFLHEETFWTGLCVFVIVLTVCLLGLHWAGVIV